MKDNLAPIGSKSNQLVPLSDLIVPLHFPEMDAKVLKQKQVTVVQALEDLCAYYADQGCTTSPKDRLDTPPQIIQTGSRMTSARWSPDGATLVSGDESGFVRSWDSNSGKNTKVLFSCNSPVWSVTISSDGRQIAFGYNHTLKIFDAATGECLQTLTGHTKFAISVAYSPDGTHIVSGSVDKSVKIWDAATGECLKTLTGHTDLVYTVAYSPDGSRILSASSDKTLRIWDAAANAKGKPSQFLQFI